MRTHLLRPGHRSWLAAPLVCALAGCGGPAVEAPAKSPPPAPLRGKGGALPAGMRPARAAGHMAAVSCLSFSPDGRRLVSGSADRSLLVWDVESGEIVQRLEGHTGFVRGCAFLPGGRVASGGANGDVFVWDVATAKILRKLGSLGVEDSVYSLAARPSGGEVMVGTSRGAVVAWETDTGLELFSNADFAASSRPSTVWTVGFSPDGRRLAGGGAGKAISWHRGDPTKIDFTTTAGVALPQGNSLLGGPGGRLRFFIGNMSYSGIGHLTDDVYAIAVSPSGEDVIAADIGGHAHVIDFSRSETLCTLDSESRYWAAAWSPTGDRVAVGGNGGDVLVADVTGCRGGNPLPLRSFGAPSSRVGALAIGESLLLGDGSGRVSTWDLKTWGLTASVAAHRGEVSSIACFPDGRWVSCGEDDRLILGGAGPIARLDDLGAPLWTVAPLPARNAVLVGDEKGRVTEVALPSPGVSSPPIVRWTAPETVYDLAVEPSGGAVIVAGNWRSVARVPLNTTEPPVKWRVAYRAESSSTLALALLPDGRIAHGSSAGDVHVRRGDVVEQRLSGLTAEVAGLAVHGSHLWAGDVDGKLVRHLLGGAPTPDLVLDEGAGMGALAASPAGLLVAGLDSGSASVRALPGGEPVAHLYPFRDGSGATLFADGSYDVTPGLAKGLRLEDPKSRRVVTLGEPLPLRITRPVTEPLPDGSVAVRATVISPGGPPTITLDPGFSIESVTPSPTLLSAYEVSLQIQGPRAGGRTLTARSPSGDTLSTSIDVSPAPRSSPEKTRALVITNGAYEHLEPLPWAAGDAARVRAFLEGERGFHLPPDRIESLSNLRGTGPAEQTLSGKVKAFFARAEPGETLFFYCAGHNTARGPRKYLLPVDAAASAVPMPPEPPPKGMLSTDEIWAAIEASKAARVLVMFEAAPSNWPSLRRDEGVPAKAALFSANGVHSMSASDPRHFTTIFFDALDRPGAVAPDGFAVTVGSVFQAFQADPYVFWEMPRLAGAGEILRLPLSFPTPHEVRRRALSAKAPEKGTGFRSITADLVTGVRERNASVELRFAFERSIEAIKISSYSSTDGPPAAPEAVRIVSPPEGFAGGKEETLSMFGVRPDQRGTLEVRACTGDGKTCQSPVVLAFPKESR